MAEHKTDMEILEFNTDESYFLAICIDEQTSTFRKGYKNPRILVSGKKVESAILNKNLVNRSNCRLFAASCDKEHCSFVGLKRAFVGAAEAVGERGIFFFHFSGHGVTKPDFGLASMDYDESYDKCITATTLREWLKEAKCMAKYIVFTLDSCDSGGIAEALTRGSSESSPSHEFQIMTSGKIGEASFTIESLGSSIFSFFLSYVIETTCNHGEYPIKTIHDRCRKLSKALSSLFIQHSQIGPYEKTTNIVLKSTPLSELMNDLSKNGDAKEQMVNTNTGVGFPFCYPIKSHYTHGKTDLHIVSCIWLNACHEKELPILAEDGPQTWDQSLVEAVLHGMMRSTAILEQQYAPNTVATTNIYITAFMYVVTAIWPHKQIEFDKYYCRKGLEYYIDGLHNICQEEMEPLKQLERKLCE